MKRIITVITVCFMVGLMNAQNVGINTTGANPDNSAMLDVVSTSKGMLIPRVALTATNAAGPISAPTTSLLVYNTATAGAAPNNVTPGFYYWDGSAWQRFDTSNNTGDWKLSGNSGTTASSSAIGVTANNNFIGTTDAIDYVFATNGLERMRLKTDNTTTARLGIGTAFTSNLNSGSTPSLIHLHDWGTTANDYPIVQLSTANTASGRTVGIVNFASTATANEKRIATIESYLTAASGTNGTGDLRFFTNNNNTLQEKFRLGPTEAVINEQSIDYDFRVEGNGDANLFFVNAGNDRVGVGLNGPTTKLEVSSGASDAIYGHSTNVGGYLGYETNFTFGVTPQTIQGSGVWAANPSAGYASVYAQSTGAATVAANINYSSVWIPTYSLSDNSSTSGQRAIYGQANLTNNTNSNLVCGIQGYLERGGISGNPGFSVGTYSISSSDNQDSYGFWGTSFSDQGTGGTFNFGGYFEAYNYTGATQRGYAFVGGRFNGSNRKIEGSGSVNEIVPTADHGRVTLVCPESPEYWYQDYYTVEMVNGRAHLDLDPILVDIIVVDQDNPIRVFVTPSNMPYFNGVTTMNQTTSGIDLIELNGGTNSGTLQVQVIVKPKTNFGEGRFVQAPGPAWLKPEQEPEAAKAANQGSDEIFNWPADWEVYGYEELAKQKLAELRKQQLAEKPKQ
ncbi:MAG: hypothetical protein H6598_02340 [Flavobacteriales bacterium]|nr:hypothetical protein [Flavobacteriales bacterium]